MEHVLSIVQDNRLAPIKKTEKIGVVVMEHVLNIARIQMNHAKINKEDG
jgi:hypothetical protein